MSDEFKRLAATEISEFKAEYLARFPGEIRGTDRRGPPSRGDEHRRQAGSSRRGRSLRPCRFRCSPKVGRQHRLPRPRCEGFRNTVALRAGRWPGTSPKKPCHRRDDHFSPEYRRSIRRSVLLHSRCRSVSDPKILPPPDSRSRPGGASRSRDHLSKGRRYRYAFAADRTRCDFKRSRCWCSRRATCRQRPTSPAIVGETTTHTLDDLKNKREQEVVFGSLSAC